MTTTADTGLGELLARLESSEDPYAIAVVAMCRALAVKAVGRSAGTTEPVEAVEAPTTPDSDIVIDLTDDAEARRWADRGAAEGRAIVAGWPAERARQRLALVARATRIHQEVVVLATEVKVALAEGDTELLGHPVDDMAADARSHAHSEASACDVLFELLGSIGGAVEAVTHSWGEEPMDPMSAVLLHRELARQGPLADAARPRVAS